MPQRSYFYVMTISKPLQPGLSATLTTTGTVTPPEAATREDIYDGIYDSAISRRPELDRGSVLFFSLEPNTL
jgi:hypothetical protein